MASYKGVELADNLYSLIRYMSGVDEYRENLQTLQSVWDNLTLLGQLSGTGINMSGTRHAFLQLTESLLNNLGQETLKKSVLEMKSKAQVAVDIMIRNLFERTADIGFLATDDDVRDYLERHAELQGELAQSAGEETAGLESELCDMASRLKDRFAEYVRKYSVYFDIILLDTSGKVVARLDDSNPVGLSSDPLIQESLLTPDAYVETFRHSDLLPSHPTSLIYSYRVTSRQGDKALGVLCLCFRFENETESIFANLAGKDDWSVIMILDKDGRVIASSEEHHIPVGAKLEPVLHSDWGLVRFAGQEYIAVTRPTKGYQGYMGLGWYGHVMVPVQYAFDSKSAKPNTVSLEALAVVMANPNLFSEDLRSIPRRAEGIQRELNRSVWNGNVLQSSDQRAINPAFSKILLWEISNTGLKTKDMFERSIDDLHQTVVSSVLQDSRFLASLAIDIMDRNLYERANDCRWWALTSEFRRRLENPELSDDDLMVISDILAQINSLYTVYENLVLFDARGKIVAVSNPAYQELIGTSPAAKWIDKTLSLHGSQDYEVSDFATTQLYRNRHTYVYGAVICSLANPAKTVGGIGIVFDAEPQFDAMLTDALPRAGNGDVRPGCFGVFAERSRKVIASTRQDIPPGTLLDIDKSFFELKNGEGISKIVEYQGMYYAVGSRMSKGYREYKSAMDNYHNDVAALIFIALGEVSAGLLGQKAVRKAKARLQTNSVEHGDVVEIATFYAGDQWLGVPCNQVIEAIDDTGITAVPAAAQAVRGMIMFRGKPISVVSLNDLLQCQELSGHRPESQIVVIQGGEYQDPVGLLVDALGEIPEVAAQRIEKMHPHLMGANGLTESLVNHHEDGKMTDLLVILSVDRIRHRIAELQGIC